MEERMTQLKTQITFVGPDVADLADAGVVILFADGAPPELSEVSVLHKPEIGPTSEPPAVGSVIAIGALRTSITALGESAWKKVLDLGHVVINFNDATSTERPGEICASPVDLDQLKAALAIGGTITIGA
jgi:PTS system glucitol/sorbitol-specific IIA component